MTPYLTADEIIDRLSDRFGIEAEILDGDAEIASDELDSMSPFIGARAEESQERDWPRYLRLWEDPGTPEMPDAVLDWVALKAYSLSIEHEPGVRSEGAGRVSVSYSEPKRSQLERRMSRLLDPYLLRIGTQA